VRQAVRSSSHYSEGNGGHKDENFRQQGRLDLSAQRKAVSQRIEVDRSGIEGLLKRDAANETVCRMEKPRTDFAGRNLRRKNGRNEGFSIIDRMRYCCNALSVAVSN
jgi:hypothetical protein